MLTWFCWRIYKKHGESWALNGSTIPNEATKTSIKPSLKLTANAPENRGPLESRRFLLETTIFRCENVSFREGIKTHIPTYNRFLQQSLVPWFLQVAGTLGSSKIGSCYHWNPLNPYLLKVFEISMTDFKNQCFGSRYSTISHIAWNPFANWSQHLSDMFTLKISYKTT